MSVPTFVASTSNALTTAGTGPLSVAVPTGVANGDLLITHVGIAANVSTTVTVPAGWTEIILEGRASVYARLASSEPASYNWSVGASAEYSVICHAYRPSSGSWTSLADAIAIAWSQTVGSANTQALPELPLPASMDMMLVGFVALGRGSTTTTKPATYTLAENPDSGGTTSVAIETAGAYKSVTAGLAPSDTFSTTNSSGAVTVHLAIIDPATPQPRLIRAWYSEPGVGTSGTGITVKMPFCGVGDVLVGVIACGTSATSITPPSGWTVAVSSSLTGNDTLRFYTKVAAGTEGASQTWSIVSGTDTFSGGIIVVPSATGIAYSANATDTTSDTTYTIPAVTMPAQTPAAVLLGAVAPDRADRIPFSAVPSGMTLLYTARASATAANSLHGVAWKFETGANPASGSFTGTGVATNSGIQAAVTSAVAAVGRAWGYILG